MWVGTVPEGISPVEHRNSLEIKGLRGGRGSPAQVPANQRLTKLVTPNSFNFRANVRACE